MNKTWLGIFFSVLIWSVVNPKDYLTWLLETMPAMVAFIILMTTRQRFPLTGLAYGNLY
jgi:putative membrane protein